MEVEGSVPEVRHFVYTVQGVETRFGALGENQALPMTASSFIVLPFCQW